MYNYVNFSNKNIKFLREMKKLSQGQLAKNLKIDQSTLAKWENNTRQITLGWSIKIAEYFNIPLQYFVLHDLENEKNLDLVQKDIISLSEQEEFELLKDVFRKKGILDENDNMSKEDFEKYLDFAKRNKDFFIRKNDNSD